jgi:hypothetical protein
MKTSMTSPTRNAIPEGGKPARASLMTEVKNAATVKTHQCRRGVTTSTLNRMAFVGHRTEI